MSMIRSDTQGDEACSVEQPIEPSIGCFVDQPVDHSNEDIVDQPMDCSSGSLIEHSSESVLEHFVERSSEGTSENRSQRPPDKSPLDARRHVLTSHVLQNRRITIDVNPAPTLLPDHLTRSLYPPCYPQGRAVACCNSDVQRASAGLSSAATSKSKLYCAHMTQPGFLQ